MGFSRLNWSPFSPSHMEKIHNRLEEGKWYEIKIAGFETKVYQMRGFVFEESDYTLFVILWEKGDSRGREYLSYDIESIKEIQSEE